MSGLRIFANGWTHLACDAFNCNKTPTAYAIGVPDGPPGNHQRFCEADMLELIANLPDTLLPAAGALVIKHVLERTEFGVEIWDRFRAAQPGTTNEGNGGTLAITGGTGADPDPAAQLASIEALVLDHVANGTEWAQALVAKIAEALPDEVAPDGIPDASTPPVPDAAGADPDPAAQLVAFEAAVLRHVPGGTGWGLARELLRVRLGAEALPDDGGAADVSVGAVAKGDGIADDTAAIQAGAAMPAGATLGDDSTAGGESPVNPEAEHSCVCGWAPKPGSDNPERDLKAHQRFCKVLKEQKGAD